MGRENAVSAVEADVCPWLEEATPRERAELGAHLASLAKLLDQMRARGEEHTLDVADDELPPTVRHHAARGA